MTLDDSIQKDNITQGVCYNVLEQKLRHRNINNEVDSDSPLRYLCCDSRKCYFKKIKDNTQYCKYKK